jgi:hypothetical protein
MSKIIRILGGGTFSHVRNHLALSAPAFGETARKLDLLFYEALGGHSDHKPGIPTVQLHLTRMANPTDKQAAVTNDHVAGMLDRFITDPNTRVIIMNAALCDFNGYVAGAESDKYADRLHSRDIKPMSFDSAVLLTAAPKLVGRIRKERKDIFAVAFKTTCGATPDEQYIAGLEPAEEELAEPRRGQRHQDAPQHDHRARRDPLFRDRRPRRSIAGIGPDGAGAEGQHVHALHRH